MISEINSNVIKYKIEEYERVDEFVIKMQHSNRIPGLVVLGRDGDELLFAVSKLIPLADYLRNEVHSVDDTLSLINQYNNIIDSAENHMIPRSEVILSMRLAFVDKADKSLMLCCIPTDMSKIYTDTFEEFRTISLALAGYENDDERARAIKEIQGIETEKEETPPKKKKEKPKLFHRIKIELAPKADDDIFGFDDEPLPEGVNMITVRSTGDEYPLLFGPDIIGSDDRKASICFPNNLNMEGEHASITVQKGKYYIADLNSTAGTTLNGESLEPGKAYELHSADLIAVAGEELVFVKRI